MLSIENQIALENCLYVVEMFNANDGTYYYYMSSAYSPMVFMFDCPDFNRYTEDELIRMYQNHSLDQYIDVA